MSLYKVYDFSKFEIESNVSRPMRISNSSQMRDLFYRMIPGESVKLPIDLLRVAQNMASASGHAYSIRENRNTNTFRIWKNN